MIKFFRILFIFFFLLLSFLTVLNPAKTETNILRAVLPDNEHSELIMNLNSRFSSKINVLIESKSYQDCDELAKVFIEKVDKKSFRNKSFDYLEGFNFYKKYHNNFLSERTRELIIEKDYETVEKEAFERLINPIGISILPVEEDPFLLFTDYITGLSNINLIASGDIVQFKDKYYKYILLESNIDTLSPTTANEKIANLVSIADSLNNKSSSKVYLTGVPIHSYYASSASMSEINIICILSSIFLFALFYFYFRNIKLIIPAFVSLFIGILSGFSIVSLLFDKVHILTFVFSTTLIGICIDYSLHYFVEKDLKKIIKSLTLSLLSTSCAFIVLIFSQMDLLKQISVFTVVGLISVYLFVVLFYPLICKYFLNDFERKIDINIRYEKLIISIVIIVIICGFINLKFDDNIKNMYVPSKELAYAEKLFAQVTNSNFKQTFLVVEGKSFEDILQKEEIISKKLKNYQSVSKYIPSRKRQFENKTLIENLYSNSLNKYAQFLTKEQRNTLLNDNFEYINYDEKYSILSEFMIDENKSLMILDDEDKPDIEGVRGIQYIDLKSDISSKIKDYRVKCIRLILPILFILVIVLSIIYKNFLKSIKIVLPSILAASFSFAFVSLIFKEINMFHILSIFLILGFGLDYSIFRASGVKNSSGAILLSCATSVFSFALLSFTSFKLISSLGVILSIGLLSSYILSLVLIPASGFEENKDNI